MTKKITPSPKRPRWQSLVGTGIALLVILFVYLRTGTVPDELLEGVLGTDAATVSAILRQTPQAPAAETPTTTPKLEPSATPTPTQPPAQTPTAVLAATARPSLTPTITSTATATSQPTATATGTRPPTRAPPTPTATPTRLRSQSGLPFILYNDLPPEAKETIGLIDNNGPFPFRQDDSTFQNREGILPSQPRGWYREFTVITPGSRDRGARRIVEGEDGLLFYTDDHYASFREVMR
ncbi:MAG: hypothetical protein KJZ86_20705 [Caldilineaceae bacterium]|nr:hypothetical protein [Caldilineaceae bacterium]